MDKTPEQFPATGIDQIIATGVDLGVGEFMLHLELEFDHAVHEQLLADALHLLLDAHPILGCRFIADPRRPYWEKLEADARQIFYMTSQEAEYNNFRIQILETRAEPQIKACLFRSAQGDRLLLKVSHQLCDAGGVKDIAGDLAFFYRQLEKDPCYKPAARVSGSRDLRQIMRHVPWHARPALIVNLLRVTLANQVPQITHTLTLKAEKRAPLKFILRHIPFSRVTHIVDYAREHQATINDVMTAAFHRALAVIGEWDGQSALRVQTTVDLRRWYLPADRAEGICNLSTHEYSNLGTRLGNDFTATLKRVCAITKRRKKNWIGLTEVCLTPLLGRLPYRTLLKLMSAILRQRLAGRNMQNSLTNLGPIDAETVAFGGRPRNAWILPPAIYPPLFCAGFSGYSGSLTLSAGVPEASSEIIERLFDQVLAELPV